LKEVQEQKRNRSRAAKAAWLEEHGRLPCLHPLMPKVAFLPDDKKNLVEWNNFVNQMTATLLNLKGLPLLTTLSLSVMILCYTKMVFHRVNELFFVKLSILELPSKSVCF